ncbi:MAG: PD-(D/E)XK nuclease family protein [Termitinemataceae bacterium]|nr:MAG: PD-(D/E)XK nuclease family protein [Termitinemataceae bacterium]
MTSVIELNIRQYIKNQNCYFVFPSDIDAQQWGRKSCTFDFLHTVASDRFLAWDKFKEMMCKTDGGLRPVSAELRLLFTTNLIKRNKEAVASGITDNGLPLISVIPKQFAEDGGIFADSITATLPYLTYWQQRHAANGGNADNEDTDLLTIKKLYNDFLSATNTYEISDICFEFAATDNCYIIFYPELIEDWSIYKDIFLEHNDKVKIVKIQQDKIESNLNLYESARTELRGIILSIKKLYEEDGVAYEDIAVNVPDLKNIEAYIKREFALYDIPMHAHSGRALAEYETGRFWKAADECVQNNWTFKSIKALLFNNHLPWKMPDINQELIRFAINNNCLCGYYEDSGFVDVLENALFLSPNTLLHEYYKKLKKTVTGMTHSKSFTILIKNFFDFRKYFFSEQSKDEDEDKESYENKILSNSLSRCIEELWNLVNIEKKYSIPMPENPYSFFISMLKKKQYVPAREDNGVHIFEYRVAAASPFKYRFIMNVSQNAASIVYKPLKFLNNDKRKALNVEDISVSAEYFKAYNAQYISCSLHAFSGWSLPHSFWNDRIKNAVPQPDSYTEEKSWWADEALFPVNLYPAQKMSFKNWFAVYSASKQNAKEGKQKIILPEYKEKIMQKDHNVLGISSNEENSCIKVSASDLNIFFECPQKWLYGRLLDIKELKVEAEMLDADSKGLILHLVLSKLYKKIKETDKIFIAKNIPLYKEWLFEITSEYFLTQNEHPSVLIKPFVVPLTRSVCNILGSYLVSESKKYDGYGIDELECYIEQNCELPLSGSILLKGFIDRVSIDKKNNPVIIDYKTKNTPAIRDCTANENGDLFNFQMAVYVKLYENLKNKKIASAVFASLVDRDYTTIIDDETKKDRAVYQNTMYALEEYLKIYHDKVLAYDLSTKDVSSFICHSCDYKTVCRKTYHLNTG